MLLKQQFLANIQCDIEVFATRTLNKKQNRRARIAWQQFEYPHHKKKLKECTDRLRALLLYQETLSFVHIGNI